MKPPTPKQIAKELATLQDMAPRIRQEDAFGGDNRAKIDAEIEVIENDMEESEIYDKEDSEEWDADTVSSAITARQWLDGESEDGPPSEGWKGLLPK